MRRTTVFLRFDKLYDYLLTLVCIITLNDRMATEG
jgi:hypothetical protein